MIRYLAINNIFGLGKMIIIIIIVTNYTALLMTSGMSIGNAFFTAFTPCAAVYIRITSKRLFNDCYHGAQYMHARRRSTMECGKILPSWQVQSCQKPAGFFFIAIQ